MLMPDPAAAFADARRVLRPGGRPAFAVFGPPDRNLFFAIAAGALVRRGHIPPPAPPPAPGLFALADPARTERLLREAGFTDVRTEQVPITFPVTDAAGYLAFIGDTAGPLALAIPGRSAEDRAARAAAAAAARAPLRGADGTTRSRARPGHHRSMTSAGHGP